MIPSLATIMGRIVRVILIGSLVSVLAVSLFLNVYFYLELSKTNPEEETAGSSFFSFVFGPTMQNLSEGNLYLNMTLDVVDGNLTVRAEINSDEYNPKAFLVLQFDSDNNGTIDIRYWPNMMITTIASAGMMHNFSSTQTITQEKA